MEDLNLSLPDNFKIIVSSQPESKSLSGLNRFGTAIRLDTTERFHLEDAVKALSRFYEIDPLFIKKM